MGRKAVMGREAKHSRTSTVTVLGKVSKNAIWFASFLIFTLLRSFARSWEGHCVTHDGPGA